MIACRGNASPGAATADCRSATNPIALRTCTLEDMNAELSVIIPCMSSHTIISIIIIIKPKLLPGNNKILTNSSSPLVINFYLCALIIIEKISAIGEHFCNARVARHGKLSVQKVFWL